MIFYKLVLKIKYPNINQVASTIVYPFHDLSMIYIYTYTI